MYPTNHRYHKNEVIFKNRTPPRKPPSPDHQIRLLAEEAKDVIAPYNGTLIARPFNDNRTFSWTCRPCASSPWRDININHSISDEHINLYISKHPSSSYYLAAYSLENDQDKVIIAQSQNQQALFTALMNTSIEIENRMGDSNKILSWLEKSLWDNRPQRDLSFESQYSENQV